MLHEHFTALCAIDAELLAMEFSYCGLHIRTSPVLPEDTPDVQIRTFYVKAFESYQ